jgi:hypothetical protein
MSFILRIENDITSQSIAVRQYKTIIFVVRFSVSVCCLKEHRLLLKAFKILIIICFGS